MSLSSISCELLKVSRVLSLLSPHLPGLPDGLPDVRPGLPSSYSPCLHEAHVPGGPLVCLSVQWPACRPCGSRPGPLVGSFSGHSCRSHWACLSSRRLCRAQAQPLPPCPSLSWGLANATVHTDLGSAEEEKPSRGTARTGRGRSRFPAERWCLGAKGGERWRGLGVSAPAGPRAPRPCPE